MPNPDRTVPETGMIVLAGRRYTVLRNFGDLPATIAPARVSMVAVDSHRRVHVLRRGPAPAVVFDADGRFLYSYGEGHVFDSHGITIDHQDRVFIVDRDAHQVLCFNLQGALLFALGERHRPSWEDPFNHPTKVAVASDGDIYVADGYGNARVHRFDRNGTLRSSFGSIGHGPGAFMTPHSILIDSHDHVLVCDRENDRVQVFDRQGGWLANLDGLCRPMDLCALPDGTILVTDQVPSLTAFSPDGVRLGRARPSLNGAHGIAADPHGGLYLAEIDPSSISKLTLV
ncbi:6-bladed beta-propeller [Lichenifustis flavocetrariae]|uniref:6-bladed beta-propeller n=1 Tax=Lichenifustis flavocetrariae TaxID=2949735 RepID=A0AA41YXT5_9HYPH|nr:6-bladed beta-propeller [Lichenifustis flavocetrariae]MCW6509285.1 6-bladed beta-propeller [Lichenifustis flavocetrariae]